MIFSTAQTPLNIYRALPTNAAENKILLLFLRMYVPRILVQTNERVFLPANITDLFFFFRFLLSRVVHCVLQTKFLLSPSRKLCLSSEHDATAETSNVRLAMRLSGRRL